MHKRLFAALFAVIMIINVSFAYSFPILVKVNDQYVDVGEIVVIDGVHYVAARQLADCLGVLTIWEAPTKTAHFVKYNKRLIVGDGQVKQYIDDAYSGNAEGVMPTISNGKTYLPLTFFVSYFESSVDYNQAIHTYSIKSDSQVITDEQRIVEQTVTDDLLWLARIIHVEARGDSLYKKLAVGNVVMNRVDSPRFPNSIYGVIKAKGQFPPAYYSYFDSFDPSDAAKTAAVYAYMGENVVEDCLYFNLKPFKWKPQADFYREIEGDYFYR